MKENILLEQTIYLAPSNNEQIPIKSEAVTAEIEYNGDTYSASGGDLEYCRLCANQTDSPVNIFASEATDKCLNMNLYEKLVTYFPIIISKAII